MTPVQKETIFGFAMLAVELSLIQWFSFRLGNVIEVRLGNVIEVRLVSRLELVLFLQLLCSWRYNCKYVSMSRVFERHSYRGSHGKIHLLAPFLHIASDQKLELGNAWEHARLVRFYLQLCYSTTGVLVWLYLIDKPQ